MRLNYFILILNLQSKHQMVKTDIFSIPAGILQGDTLAPFLFIIVIDYVMRASIDNKNRKDATKNFPTICIENALEQIDIDTIPTLLTFFLKMRVS